MSDPRRVRGHLSWRWVDVRMSAMREIWVSMTRPDQRPHAVPVWFWWDGTSIYFTARAETLKPRSLAERPAIVVHNGDGVEPIIIEGIARPVTEQSELERLSAAYGEKYVAPTTGDRATVDPAVETAFRIELQRVQAWSYANAGTQTVWLFEAPD